MRTSGTLIAALCCATALNAQTTALDFDTADCHGWGSHLFAELDAGHAVVFDLVMLGCQPCATASWKLANEVVPFTDDPARVRLYSIGYSSETCPEMTSWALVNGITHPVFAGMSAQTAYYGGMGMPTIVVLGGASHTVFYNGMGYPEDSTDVLLAINQALGATSVEEPAEGRLAIGPNPADDLLSVTGRWAHAEVLDPRGRKVAAQVSAEGQVNVAGLPAGLYLLRMTAADGRVGTARFVKR